MAAARRNPSLLAKLLLALSSVLLVLLVAEAVARVVGPPGPARPPRSVRAEWAALPQLENGGMSVLKEPGARGVAAGALIEMNGAGLRGPERPVAKPEGVYRIALIGDSIAMGWGVLYEETYGALVEERLERERSDRDYEVLNVGLSGYNTQAVVNRLQIRGMVFDPDLIVYGYTLNDIEGDHYAKRSSRGFADPLRYARSPSHLWRIVAPKLDALRDSLWPAPDSYTHELFYNYFDNPRAWADVEAGFDKLRERADRQGACVVLLLHTQLTSLGFLHPFGPLYERVAEAGRARGFHVVPSLGQHDGAKERDLWVLAYDHHPNADGHQRLADALMEGLATLPDRCW